MERQPQNPEFRINAETFYHALTHISLASFLLDISKEWRPRSDTADPGS